MHVRNAPFKQIPLLSFVIYTFLLSGLFAPMPAFSRTIYLFGVEEGIRANGPTRPGDNFRIQLGSFRNKEYALAFKERSSHKTNATIHLAYDPNASIPYQVFIGPLDDVDTVHRISREFMSGSPVKPVTTSKSPAFTGMSAKGGYFSGMSKVVTLSLGPVWEKVGDTQTFFLAPNIEKTYAAHRSSHALVDGELFLAFQKPLREQLEGQLGLAVATTGNASLSGQIWDDADVVFNNYTYSYQIRHTHLALKGKVLRDIGYYKLIPWVSGSLGVGFNKSHDFTNTPTITEAVVMPNFSGHTTTTLTYTLGLGFQRELKQHWQAGIGYEFADWGKTRLNRAPGQTANNGLFLSHLYTNGFLLNLTYLGLG